MKRKLSLVVLTVFFAFKSWAQLYDSTGYYNQLNYIFAPIDKTQISSGLLQDFSVEFNNWDNFTGTVLHDSNFVSLSEWRQLYAGIYTSQIRGNTNLLYLDTINRLVSKYSYSNQPVSMAVLYFNYQSIKPNAVSSNLLQNVNGQLRDVAGRPQSPYNTKEMFAVAPIRQAMHTGSNQVIFRSDLLIGNTGKTISTIQLDPTGSGSWQTVALNTPFTVTYASEGFYNVNIRITYTDGSQRLSHTKLSVYAGGSGGTVKFGGSRQNSLCSQDDGFLYKPYEYGDNPLAVENISATKPYLGLLATGDITIEYAQGNTTGQIRKPLIVAEGFDLNNDYRYGSFSNSISFDDNIRANITLNDNLDDIGEYDIIFVNWRNATDYMQRNAYLLERVIQVVNGRKTLYNGVRQQNVIIGLSMGGIIARYALKDMENTGVAHETRLFIAHDAPFKGANIPVAFQAAVQHLGPWKIINVGGGFPFIRYVDLIPEVAGLLNTFNSPAASQLIIQRYTLNTSNGALTANNTAYTNFQNELNTLGWPANSRNIIISNGSCNGTKVFTASNANFFTISGENRSMTYFGSLWRSLALSLGGILTPTSILTGPGNPQPNAFALLWEFPLTFLSTKTSIGMIFACNAIPNSGTAQIYKGQIYSKKKVLGLFNVTSNFINLTCNSNSSMAPIDNAPGGTYDMEEFGLNPSLIQAQLPRFFADFVTATINQSAFCFVPTVSSIAHNTASSSWLSPVCDIAECVSPTQVADIYLQNANQLHISYTQANGDWIMQRQNSLFVCAKVCQSNAVINGAAILCTNSPYTLAGVPAGVSVTWSSNAGGLVGINPIGPTTNLTTTLTRVGNVNAILRADVTGACRNFFVTKPIAVGLASAQITIRGIQPVANGQMDVTVTTDAPPPYKWYVDNNLVSTASNKDVTINGGSCGFHNLKVEVTNTCGVNSTTTQYNRVCQGMFRAVPNPALSIVTIDAQPPSEAMKIANETVNISIETVKIFDQAGNLKRQWKFSKGSKQVQINVSGLQYGVYVIEIMNNGQKENQQLIIGK